MDKEVTIKNNYDTISIIDLDLIEDLKLDKDKEEYSLIEVHNEIRKFIIDKLNIFSEKILSRYLPIYIDNIIIKNDSILFKFKDRAYQVDRVKFITMLKDNRLVLPNPFRDCKTVMKSSNKETDIGPGYTTLNMCELNLDNFKLKSNDTISKEILNKYKAFGIDVPIFLYIDIAKHLTGDIEVSRNIDTYDNNNFWLPNDITDRARKSLSKRSFIDKLILKLFPTLNQDSLILKYTNNKNGDLIKILDRKFGLDRVLAQYGYDTKMIIYSRFGFKHVNSILFGWLNEQSNINNIKNVIKNLNSDIYKNSEIIKTYIKFYNILYNILVK